MQEDVSMFVNLWMVTDPVTVDPAQNLRQAEELFAKHRIRRLPVVEDDILVGVISPGDLEKAMPSILDSEGGNEEEYIAENTEIRTVMTSSPLTVSADDPLVEAVRKMRINKVDGLPVVDGNRLVGVISISDVLDAFIEVMSTDKPGTRFDLKIDHHPGAFYKLMKIFQKQNREILAIYQHHGFSKNHQLVTIQTSGNDNEKLLDQLWDNKVTVERVTPII